MVNLGNDWDTHLAPEFTKPYYLQLREFLKAEYSTQHIFPDMHHIFTALQATPLSQVRVVIIGQDPYHGPGQAHGLCFSVRKGVPAPPSLVNIFKEINAELGIPLPDHGELTHWAEQGVLLLNTALTVRQGQPNSHRGKGWEQLTDAVIAHVNALQRPVVFLLWGANARAKKALINNPLHLILESAHPSPLSAYNGFFGNGHFRKTNDFLTAQGYAPIDWSLPSRQEEK